ncbi:hypothetical protein Goklo_009388 [Gossypium klotzschianum]|uniref:Uncharacterized protein n=1 Tax=Gossypium klotzschianum TaxID=34286 RepID=A0A7J8V2P6_9ROSI|nr:hypothetical protein [Gossypium klotzschianum]
MGFLFWIKLGHFSLDPDEIFYKNATADALPSPPLVKSSPRMLLTLLLGFSPMFSDECQPVIGMSGPDRGSQKEHTRLVSR